MKRLTYLFMFLVLMSSAYSIGVIPAYKDVIFEPNKTITMQLKIENDEELDKKISLSVEGELSEYIQFSETDIMIKGKDSKIISYNLAFPETAKQGNNQVRIIIDSVSDETSDSMINSEISIVSKLNIKVPYKGQYAEITLYVPNLQDQQSSNFAIQVKNLGTGNIVDGKVIIDIYGPMNDKLITLTGDAPLIEPKDIGFVYINWNPSLNPGKYFAKATFVYNGKNAYDQKPFFIGSSEITIDAITVDKFTLGGTAAFDIILSNNWNEKIDDVYADVEIKDKQENTLAISKTSTEDIDPFGKQVLKAYWNTEHTEQGEYLLEITLNYLDKQTKKVFDIYVGLDEIVTSATGRIIDTTKPEKIPTSITILTILVAVLVIINIVLLRIKLRKN